MKGNEASAADLMNFSIALGFQGLGFKGEELIDC